MDPNFFPINPYEGEIFPSDAGPNERRYVWNSASQTWLVVHPGTVVYSDGLPFPLGSSSAGTENQASRSDHVHEHGELGGGDLHDLATRCVAGFLSAPDKIKLEDATPNNIAGTLVERGPTGNFSANVITADLDGNAETATRFETTRTINGVPFDGTSNITITAKPDDEEPAVFYVRSDGDNSRNGRNPHNAFQNIEYALEQIWNFEETIPWTIKLLDGVQTSGNLEVPDFCTIMGTNMQRRTIVRPYDGDEEKNVFLCGNGVHIYGIKFTGWQIDDFDNPTKGFGMAFRPGAIILPGGVPYGQNCVVTSALTEVPTPLPMNAQLGNPAHPKGGGCVLADASVLSPYTVYPNIMTWGFTPSSANGLGYVSKNRGFINPVNAIGVGAHRHFMCLDGGQMVVSGSSSQFGDYSFWSEGSTQIVKPLKLLNSSALVADPSAGTIVDSLKTQLINQLWQYLQISFSFPNEYETLTKKDTGLFLDAISASLVHGFERPMINFAEGMFDFAGNCVFPFALLDEFKASWNWLRDNLISQGSFSPTSETAIQLLVGRLQDTIDNFWYEEGPGPAPSVIEPVKRKLRSLITAINHQWTAPLSGVEFYRVPPARLARRIQRSIVQKSGGRVRFSGQDDSGNAVFVGGLQIDSRSGQLGGPPFDSAIRGRVTRAVISRSY